MKCSKCGYDNADGSPYCGLCYEVLKKELPSAPGASPELTAALRGVMELDTPATREKLYAALLDAEFLAPLDAPDADAYIPIPGAQEKIPLYSLKTGLIALVVFTGERAFDEGSHHAKDAVWIRGRELFLLAAHADVQTIGINPDGVGIWLTEKEIRRLAEGINPATKQLGDGGVTCSPYPELHAQFAADLCAILKPHPEVSGAYALLASLNNAPPRLLLAVSCLGATDAPNAESYLPALLAVARRRGIDAYAMLVSEHPWLADVIKSTDPFFTRVGS